MDSKGVSPSKLKILVVEDNEINQKVVQRLLQRLGHQVDVASNGKEGVANALAGFYDLILMDLQMPVLDGIQAASQIMEAFSDSAKSPKIVALTAYNLKEYRKQSIEAGMVDFLAKPVRLEQLKQIIDRHFSE